MKMSSRTSRFIVLAAVAFLAACGKSHPMAPASPPPTDPNTPPVVTNTSKYKVGDTLAVAPLLGNFMFVRGNANGLTCAVDPGNVQFMHDNAVVSRFTRNQAAPPGFNRCDVATNAALFQDKENRAKVCNLSNNACLTFKTSDDATRFLELRFLSDSTFGWSDGLDNAGVMLFRSAGNFLAAPVPLIQYKSAYGRVVSMEPIEGGKYVAIATSNGCYETRFNDGKANGGYLSVGQTVCGAIAASNRAAQFAWNEKMGRLYGVIDSTLVIFTSQNGQLKQTYAQRLGSQLYMPMVNNDGLFVNTVPGTVLMLDGASPNWDKPLGTFTFPVPQYYELGAFPCPNNSNNVCLATSGRIFQLIRQ